jgi:predicted acetyltransferase
MSSDRLGLVRPSAEHEESVLQYRREFIDSGDELHGSGGLATASTFEQWLSEIRGYEDGTNVGEGKVPATQYLAVRRSDGRLVGILNLRHRLNDALLTEGGHIGFGVRMSERRRGYATEMLELALQRCRDMGISRVLVTCDEDNVGSIAVIRANGGVLEPSDEVGSTQRYWIVPATCPS